MRVTTCFSGFWIGGGKAGWEFPAPLAAGALAIALIGNGLWSLDAALGLAYPEALLPLWLLVVAAGAAAALISRAAFAPRAAAQEGKSA